MYEVKSKIYQEFSKTQKSSVCNFLKALVKKMPELSAEKVLEKFLEDENYYLKQNSSRFPFLIDFIEDESFVQDSKLYIQECVKYFEYKKAQAPLIQAQKDYEKKKRKFLQEVKMSKEEPTKKQISYYNSLCKRYNMEKDDTKDLSKLDLRNKIQEIINEHQTD